MKRLLCLTMMMVLALAFGARQAATLRPALPAKVHPALWQAAVDSRGDAEFLVLLSEQADLSGAAALSDKVAKGQFVYDALRATAQASQAELVALLDEAGVENRPFFIRNMVWANGDLAVLGQLAQRGEVLQILPNTPIPLDQLHPPASTAQLVSAVRGVGWNVAQIGADDVWQLGYTGKEIVIGGQDTGYDWDHPALINSYRGWNGSSASHDYHWHDAIHANSGANPCGANSAEPCDDHGHGTHTMGTMVGNDLPPTAAGWPAAAPNAVGVAPGATWIGCRNMDAGAGTPASYAECYEWFVAPYPVGGDKMTQGDPSRAPHVINNSWGCVPEEGCTTAAVLKGAVEAVTAAGIVSVHAAGNDGFLGCSSVSAPSAIYEASFTVGATDSQDVVAGFSSRGPVTVDGSQRLKPDVVAPGVNVRSALVGGGYGNNQGTSMAAPHVAGLVALLLDARPDLVGDVAGIEAAIRQTAVPLTSNEACGGDSPTAVPNNTYGNGRVDAQKAIAKALKMLYLPLVRR